MSIKWEASMGICLWRTMNVNYKTIVWNVDHREKYPLVTPRCEGVTSSSNMGKCAHRRAHEKLSNL
jgi:hypothetical protein